MKKYILILSLIFISTKSFAKELDLGMHKIIFPNKFNVINWNDTSFGSSFCQEFSTCFGLIDNKVLEIVNQVEAGKNFEEIKKFAGHKSALEFEKFNKFSESLFDFFKDPIIMSPKPKMLPLFLNSFVGDNL